MYYCQRKILWYSISHFVKTNESYDYFSNWSTNGCLFNPRKCQSIIYSQNRYFFHHHLALFEPLSFLLQIVPLCLILCQKIKNPIFQRDVQGLCGRMVHQVRSIVEAKESPKYLIHGGKHVAFGIDQNV